MYLSAISGKCPPFRGECSSTSLFLTLWSSNQIHFPLLRPAYDNLHAQLIHPKYFQNPCLFKIYITYENPEATTPKKSCSFHLQGQEEKRNSIWLI